MNFVIVHLAVLGLFASAEDIFEKSDHLCTRCACQQINNETLSINCAAKQMKNIIANWPANPKHLIASFSYNNITTLERMPGSDAQTISLAFDHCGIKYLQTGLFESTLNVEYVDLSHNLIESDQLTSDVFKGPYNNTEYNPVGLREINLAYNQIHSLQKNVFEHVPDLKVLNLEGNYLRIIDHVTQMALSSVRHLQSLNLANNNLVELPIDVVKHLRNLTEVNLSNNNLDFVPNSLSYIAHSLEILNIENNPIIEFTDETFLGMEYLRQLNANNLSKLIYVRANTFVPLTRLIKLELSRNENLREIDEEAFGQAYNLREVYLNDNNLLSLSPHLLPWSDLAVLDIRGNRFQCTCDLYIVSLHLSDVVKRDNDEPFCLDTRTSTTVELYSLKSEACHKKVFASGQRISLNYMHINFRMMRLSLIILCVVLIVSSFAAMWLGVSKWKEYKRVQYSFPDHIIYNPVAMRDFRI